MSNTCEIIRWGNSNAGANTSLFDYNQINLPNCSFTACSTLVSDSCISNFNSLSNAAFISGMYCELLDIFPSSDDFNVALNGLNSNTVSRTDLIFALSSYPAFQTKLNILNLYYTYNVTPPSKDVFKNTILPIVTSNTSIASNQNLLCGNAGCPAGLGCPAPGYNCSVGLVNVANIIYNSAEFALKNGNGVKSLDNLSFLSWSIKQNDRFGDSSAVGNYYSSNEANALLGLRDQMNVSGVLGKPLGMAYEMMYFNSLDAPLCLTCSVPAYKEETMKFKRHLTAIVINYLLNNVWITTRTNYNISKQTNYLFATPGACGTTDPTTLDNNLKNYITTGLLPLPSWGSNCCILG